MTPTRRQRVKEILAEAADRADADRPAYLDGACGNDVELRLEVESLLFSGATKAAALEQQA